MSADRLTDRELAHRDHLAMELGERSPMLADAFLRASDTVLPRLTVEQRTYWARMGLRLSSHGWKSVRLACDMFAASSRLLDVASTGDLDTLVDILCDVSAHSAELASSCLEAAPTIFARLPDVNHPHFLALARAIAARSRADIWLYFERGPDLLEAFELPDSEEFVSLAAAIVERAETPPFSLLSEIADAVGGVDKAEHGQLYTLAARIAVHDAIAAAEFLKSMPKLRELIAIDDIHIWVDEGLTLNGNNGSDDKRRNLRAFFSMTSTSADQTLAQISGRVEFEREANLLQLFGQALGGDAVHVQPNRTLAERRLGWRAKHVATTDGHTVYVPPFIDTFGRREANFDAYKVCIAHQTARLQFNSFDYRYGVDGTFLKASRDEDLASAQPKPVVPMQRLFDRFGERALIATLFSIVEDCRIDAAARREYPGLRPAFAEVKAHETGRRPSPAGMPLRRAFVENLLRASLDDSLASTLWPESLVHVLATAVAVLGIVQRPGATVQDSAEVGAWLYELCVAIPNLPPSVCPRNWRPLEQMPSVLLTELPALPPVDLDGSAASPDDGTISSPAFRGDFKPELVQMLDALADRPDLETVDLDLDTLLENSVEIDDETVTAEALIRQIEVERTVADDECESTDRSDDEDEVIHWRHYDEWDFRANDYLHGWCHVGERTASEGDLAGYDETLLRHHALVGDIRKQFEMMRPESHRKIRSLEDGHEIELEQAVEFVIDKRAGTGPTARFYSRRDKVERSVAVAFLLDVSHSTDEPAGPANHPSGRRIIDVERDAAVLIIEALEAIGDAYGIFGFSGYGRHNVSFHVIKDLEEPLEETIKRRVDGITPLRSTRMGAAIRHARSKLEAYPARVKLLILVSDGRPQDQGYGKGADDFDYALHDTRQALLEVKRRGMVPFVITVDREGPDYLKTLCDDIGYEVVAELESLPRRLPSIYRWLASS